MSITEETKQLQQTTEHEGEGLNPDSGQDAKISYIREKMNFDSSKIESKERKLLQKLAQSLLCVLQSKSVSVPAAGSMHKNEE